MEDRKHGRIDIPLSGRGRAQARDLARRLDDYPVTAIVTSPLERATATAAILAADLGLTDVLVDPALTERTFGVAEGWLEREIRVAYPTDDDIPGRESNDEVAARVLPALFGLAAGTVVVTHYGVIRSLGVGGNIENGSIHLIKTAGT